MSFGDEREPASWSIPRFLAGPFDAQDAAARAAGLDWHTWSRRTLEAAAARRLEQSAPAPGDTSNEYSGDAFSRRLTEVR